MNSLLLHLRYMGLRIEAYLSRPVIFIDHTHTHTREMDEELLLFLQLRSQVKHDSVFGLYSLQRRRRASERVTLSHHVLHYSSATLTPRTAFLQSVLTRVGSRPGRGPHTSTSAPTGHRYS